MKNIDVKFHEHSLSLWVFLFVCCCFVLFCCFLTTDPLLQESNWAGWGGPWVIWKLGFDALLCP